MGHMDTILHFGGPTVGLSLVSIGLGMIRLEEFKIARGLFWAGTICWGIPAFVWQLTTTEPWQFRVLSGAIAAMLVFVVFPGLLEWLKKRETLARAASSDPPSGRR